MTKGFRLTSVYLALLLALSSCSSKTMPVGLDNPPLLSVGSEMQKFNMQLNFRKKNFSGMLIVQQKADSEIRIVASTIFGPTLFDFGLKNEIFTVHSCVEPLRNKKVLQLFENDFKKLLLPKQEFRKIKHDNDCEKRISGRFFGKSIFQLHKSESKDFKKLLVKHPLIGITINFETL